VNLEKVREYFSLLMTEGLGLDLSDPNLSDTPSRVARMYCNEFFCGLCQDYNDFKSFPNDYNYDQIIVSDKINFVSMCSHHFLPFTGNAWVLYIPDKWLIGASKPSRLVEHFACRPQLQEHLCWQVINALELGVQPLGAMVVIRAIHQCMKCRGAKQYSGSGMITSAITGMFKTDPTVKQEGFELIKLSMLDKEK
jgi:GTP cyclohydrolase IA